MVSKKILGIMCAVAMTSSAYVGEKKSYIPLVPRRKVTPQSLTELQSIIARASVNNQKLSLAGAGTSLGGQTVDAQALMIDLSKLNKMVHLDKNQKRVTVQAGMTWKQLLSFLNPLGLSVQAMQPYCDFSIGGSLAVNAYGQSLQNCMVCDSVESIKILMPNGSLVQVVPGDELFSLVIGGYGLFGIVYEVTLRVTDNIILQKNAQIISCTEYPNHFEKEVKHDPAVELHFGKFTIVPAKFLSELLVVTYKNTNQKADLEPLEVQESSYVQKILSLVEHDWVRRFRLFVDSNFFDKNQQIAKNRVLARTLEDEKNKEKGIVIVQEYLLPCELFTAFVTFLKNRAQEYSINLLEVTVAYAKATKNCFLSSAPVESFVFRLLLRVEENEQSYNEVAYWTQIIIDKVTKLGGTYHLAYHLFAPRQLLKNAYPSFDGFVTCKKKYDPKELLINQFYRKYVIRR